MNRPVTGSLDRTVVLEALERHADEDFAAGLQAFDVLSRGEVGRVERVGTDEALRVVELLVVRPLDQHAGRRGRCGSTRPPSHCSGRRFAGLAAPADARSRRR